ncbi:MAG TPA: P1 family peptidase [Terriglobales bacterium]|nr:P1 family peptidase [Terriglobales bacterium]
MACFNEMATNSSPVPLTSFTGPALELDFPGLHIGAAEYEEGPTGATVFYFPAGAMAAVDVRGGAAATVNTERLRLGHERPTVRAVVFAGGASYGLEAAAGVMSELLTRDRQATHWERVPTVTGAVVYDFRHRSNTIYPDKELGRAALGAARPGHFPLGARGAGRCVHVGKFLGPRYMETAGQGGAFRQVGRVKIAVFTVVNAVGAIVDREGRVVRGNRAPESGLRTSFAADLLDGTGQCKRQLETAPGTPLENTTLTLLVINRCVRHLELGRLAIQTHTSMARAIQPFHTENDGDVLFAVSTGELEDTDVSVQDLAIHAGEVAWDAVLGSWSEG